LAHIINLATQLLIATRSKAKYYSVHDANAAEDDNEDVGTVNDNRDEVGLVRGICVKVCSPFFLSFKFFYFKQFILGSVIFSTKRTL
jgi:hypothetical protein